MRPTEDIGEIALHNFLGNEYKALRDEMTSNRRFVFERPLIIVGISLAATLKAPDVGNSAVILALFLALVLFFNLWFTFNRIKSNSRIVAYIRVAHEGLPAERHTGWESALARYRKWRVAQSDQENSELDEIYSTLGEVPQTDSHRFYMPIYWFHLCVGGLAALAVMLTMAPLTSPNSADASRLEGADVLTQAFATPLFSLLLRISVVLIYVTGIYVSLKRWHPNTINNVLGIEHAIWERVLGLNKFPRDSSHETKGVKQQEVRHDEIPEAPSAP